MTVAPDTYAARLQIDYPERLDRLTTFFRLIWIIPIGIMLTLLTGSGGTRTIAQTGKESRVLDLESWEAWLWRQP